MTLSLPAGARARPDIVRTFQYVSDLVSTPPPEGADPIAFMRELMERYGAIDPVTVPDDVEVRAVDAGGVPAEWLLPPGWTENAGTRLVYAHGGSWAAGSPASHRPMLADLATRLGYPILSVDYALAPERPFPAGLEDCVTALAWARRHGPDGEAPADLLGLGGDSAGANIAAAATVKGIDEGGEVPDRLLLFCASLELASDPGRRAIPDPLNGYERQETQIAGIYAYYVQGAVPSDHPLVSPLHAADEVLAQFPPTLLQASACEFLLWDAQQFAQRLAAQSVRHVLSIWPDLPHVWQIFPHLPEADAALAEAAAFLTFPTPRT